MAIGMAIGVVMMIAAGIAIGVLFQGIDSYRNSGTDVTGFALVFGLIFFVGLILTMHRVHRHRWLN